MSGQATVNPVALGTRMGLFAGIASLLFLLLLYGMNPAMLISPLILAVFVIVVAFKVAAAYRLWRNQNGQVAFKGALQSIFMVSVVSLLIVFFFLYLLFNVFDVSLTEQVKKSISANMMQSFEQGRITKTQLDEGLLRLNNFKPGIAAFSALYCFTLFVGFFYALVFAGISRLSGREISSANSSSC